MAATKPYNSYCASLVGDAEEKLLEVSAGSHMTAMSGRMDRRWSKRVGKATQSNRPALQAGCERRGPAPRPSSGHDAHLDERSA
jgi:hypothetical protein